MGLLREYLKKLNSNMQELLSKYTVVTYDKEETIELGLLKYNTPPKGKAFLFKFPDEKMRLFHTIDMKFPIDIYFFDKNEEIVYSYKNVQPGIQEISSKRPAKYVVEIP